MAESDLLVKYRENYGKDSAWKVRRRRDRDRENSDTTDVRAINGESRERARPRRNFALAAFFIESSILRERGRNLDVA